MKRIAIDFDPSLRNRLGITPVWIGVALAGLVAIGCAVWHWNNWFEQEQKLSTRLIDLQRKYATSDLIHNAAAVAISAPQADAINTATRHLNVPWRDLFEAVEAATPPEVALLSLEPDPDHQLLSIIAEAETSDAMLDYIKLLKTQQAFSSAVLKQHQTDSQTQNRMLRFTINLSIAPFGGSLK